MEEINCYLKSKKKIWMKMLDHIMREAATRGVLCKKLFLEISQYSQENTCARDSFLIVAGLRPSVIRSDILDKLPSDLLANPCAMWTRTSNKNKFDQPNTTVSTFV